MYKCKYCDYKIAFKSSLVEHLREMHPEKVSHYEDDDDLLDDLARYVDDFSRSDSNFGDRDSDF